MEKYKKQIKSIEKMKKIDEIKMFLASEFSLLFMSVELNKLNEIIDIFAVNMSNKIIKDKRNYASEDMFRLFLIECINGVFDMESEELLLTYIATL